jgi:hypothetical protein
MSDISEVIKNLWGKYQDAVDDLTEFVKDSTESLDERVAQYTEIRCYLRRVKAGEVVERPRRPGESVHTVTTDEKGLDRFIKGADNLLAAYERHSGMLLEMAFIYLVSIYEAYIQDVFGAVLLRKPEALRSKKQLTYEKILELQESGRLLDYLVEREVHELSYRSVRDQVNYYRDKFKIDLEASGVPIEVLVEINAVRNLLMHNKGVINHVFISLVPKSNAFIGHRFIISNSYWLDLVEALNRIAAYARDAIIEKFDGA